MIHPPYIILHKSEWARLRRQGGPPAKEPVNKKEEYLKAMNEQSQAWMKTWPDTLVGHLAKIEREKKEQQKANIEYINAFRKSANKSKREQSTGAIKQAKQLIFEDSNYGRKLLSALLESKAIEERETQIKFKKELQKKNAESAKESIYFCSKDEEKEKQNKIKTLECIKVNEEIALLKKERKAEDMLNEKLWAIEDEKLMKEVVQIEENKKEEIKRYEKKQQEKYETDTKNLAAIKEHDEKLVNALIDVHKREQDRIKLKTAAVLKKVYQGRPDTKWSTELYKKVEQIHAEDKLRYDDFINKGIETSEKRNTIKEADDKLQDKQKSSRRYLDAQINKITGEDVKLSKLCENKCFCDRQSLIMKVTAKPVKQAKLKTSADKAGANKKDLTTPFVSRDTLTEALRRRQKEPSPWTAAPAAHAQFAAQADNILNEIKHKCFARKVVDEYRELNCLDATTLPVPNY